MRQFAEDELEAIGMLFRGVLEIDNKLDSLKENTKTFNASRKEMFKNLAERLEVKSGDLKRGYSEYLKEIENPEEFKSAEEIVCLIKANNLLKQEAKEKIVKKVVVK